MVDRSTVFVTLALTIKAKLNPYNLVAAFVLFFFFFLGFGKSYSFVQS